MRHQDRTDLGEAISEARVAAVEDYDAVAILIRATVADPNTLLPDQIREYQEFLDDLISKTTGRISSNDLCGVPADAAPIPDLDDL